MVTSTVSEWPVSHGSKCGHLLTCSNRKGWATRSNLSSIGSGKAALTNLAASFPSRMASTACLRKQSVGQPYRACNR